MLGQMAWTQKALIASAANMWLVVMHVLVVFDAARSVKHFTTNRTGVFHITVFGLMVSVPLMH